MKYKAIPGDNLIKLNEYTFKLTEQELNILSAALVELPFKIAAPLIDRLNRQIAEQQAVKPAPKQEAKEE